MSRRRLPAALLLLALGCPGPSETEPPVATAIGCPETNDPRLDGLEAVLEAERAQTGAPAAAIAVLADGGIVGCFAVGSAHPEREEPVSPQTLFRIGSVTKMMTAAAVLQQVEAGRLELDDRVDAHLALDFQNDPRAQQMTVQQLLTHTGGYYDYLEIDSDESLESAMTGWFDEQMFLIAPPGAFWNYANPHWYMAGLLAEDLAQTPYAQLIEDDLWAPLGMERSFFDPQDVLDDGDYTVALGPDPSGASAVLVAIEPDAYDNIWGRPAGFAWSNVEDLARFIDFMLAGELEGADPVLAEDLRRAMQDPQVDMETVPDANYYGHGLFVDEGFFVGSDFHWQRRIQHGGDINGYAADLSFIPDTGFGFVGLASATGAHLPRTQAEAVRMVGGLDAPGSRPDLTADPSTWGELVGDYAEPWNIVGDFSISLEGDELRISMPTVEAAGFDYDPVLSPAFGEHFVLTVAGYSSLTSFLRDESGEVAFLRNRLFVGTPMANQLTGSERAPFDATRLRQRMAELGPDPLLSQLPPQLPSAPSAHSAPTE